ncbi:MAG: mechanosensitive ion channel [Proteobacteria bacterium]|nr:mechanosensitive ion channel [Pseudomonadota bacterium]MBU1056759.1 mechanosensitive ion channel [Pseudomonadota bacterium]
MKASKAFRRFVYRTLLLCILLLLVTVACLAADKIVDPEEPAAQALSLIEIYTWSNTLPNELIDLQKKIAETTGVTSQLTRLPELDGELEALVRETTMAESNPHLSYHQLSSLESRLAKLNLQLDVLNMPITSNIKHLETWHRGWLEKQRFLQRLQSQAKEQPELKKLLQTYDSLEQVINTGKNSIEQHIEQTLQAGKEIGEILTRVYALNDRVSSLMKNIKNLTISQTSPSMLSATFYRRIDKYLLERGWNDIRLFGEYQLRYIQQNLHGVWLAAVLILVLAISLSKSLVPPSSKWFSFASKPLITGIFVASNAFAIVNMFPVRITLPPEWDMLLLLPLIVTIALLTDNVCSTPWQSELLGQLTLFLAIIQLLTIIELPQPLIYLLVFYISLVGFVIYLYQFIRRLKKSSSQKVTWAIWLWGIFPFVIIVAGIIGYDQLAVFIFRAVLSTMVVSLMVWLMLLMISALLEMVLLKFPVDIIGQNATVIVKHMSPVLILFHGLLWLSITLVILRVYPTVAAAFDAITSIQFTFYALTITPGSMLAVVFVCYATLLCSRGLRAFLLHAVLPRYGVKTGAQVSITKLVHYAILAVGLLILLKMLGFSLGQITILGGALGVGIGFGLQAIVNNFVSGLILLFERPLKVGDMIEVGEEVGEVKELGLRATIVQTRDNAEIVIPNSELINSSVTNWTLADKQVRVKVPVSAAYGSDIPTILKVLLSSANDNPMVHSQPQPKALFLAFGASSLDFELWVWIHDFSDRFIVLSDLNQDLETQLKLAGIEIPFPQTDLHLRSIDQEAAAVLHKTVWDSEGLKNMVAVLP